MSRLFVTQRDLNFISDLTKEIVHDVIGQVVYYYPISEIKTQVHGIYNESLKKIFDNPIMIGCLVDNSFQTETKINQFGVDSQYKLEVFIQYRDLIDRGVNVNIGDFFSFSDIFYEITEKIILQNIWGLPEHKNGIKLVGTKARKGLFDTILQGPTDISHTEENAVQTTFVQQRGLVENSQGLTGDIRDLQRTGVLDEPLAGAQEVSPIGDNSGAGSTFYDEK